MSDELVNLIDKSLANWGYRGDEIAAAIRARYDLTPRKNDTP